MAEQKNNDTLSPGSKISEPKLLDTSLRDGGYAIGFQFTAQDTAILASILDRAGMDYIEVGHGLGLNASATHGRAAASDQAYLEAALGVVEKAQVGCFFIPGIGRPQDLRLAAQVGAHFIRIGVNAPEVEQAESFIRLAKDLGMTVSLNLMKSYALTPTELGRRAALGAGFGADIVCLVDSAGGMLPAEIKEYYGQIRARTPVELGYHGHNNLGLAVYNTYYAVCEGARVVDVSLQGIGRSSGNAAAELLALLLRRSKMREDLDINLLMDAGALHIKPLLRGAGLDPLDVTSGYAQFHSSYLGTILDYAGQYRIDPRQLIVRLCAEDKVNAPKPLLERLSREIAEERVHSKSFVLPVLPPSGAVPADQTGMGLADQVEQVVEKMNRHASKLGRQTVFNLVFVYKDGLATSVSPFVHISSRHVLGEALVADLDGLRELARGLGGKVDVILLDCERKLPASAELQAEGIALLGEKAKVLRYPHLWTWAWAAHSLILELAKGVPGSPKMALVGEPPLRDHLAQLLEGSGISLLYSPGRNGAGNGSREESLSQIDFLVACGLGAPCLDPHDVDLVKSSCVIIDAGFKSLSEKTLNHAHERGIKVLRRDIRPFLGGIIEGLLAVRALVEEDMGRTKIAGVPVVAGGVLGRPAEVVVDSVSRPADVLGLADGLGGVTAPTSPAEASLIRLVQEEIMRSKILACQQST